VNRYQELEQCTGEKIHLKTREEILAEQEMFQHSSAAGWLDVHTRRQEQRDKFEAAMQRGRERIAAEKKAENAKYTFKVSQDRVNKEGAGLDPWL